MAITYWAGTKNLPTAIGLAGATVEELEMPPIAVGFAFQMFTALALYQWFRRSSARELVPTADAAQLGGPPEPLPARRPRAVNMLPRLPTPYLLSHKRGVGKGGKATRDATAPRTRPRSGS